LVETDAPWCSPVPFRGKPNTPEYLPYTITAIANELNISEKQLSEIIFNNSVKLFNI
jgi:TatD DNase family protein